MFFSTDTYAADFVASLHNKSLTIEFISGAKTLQVETKGLLYFAKYFACEIFLQNISQFAA